MELLLTHCDADGTLLDGTSRGDAIAEIIKPLGWRWSRQLEQWYLPASRERAPRHERINTTVATLTAAGHQVRVDIDTHHDPAATDQRLADRSAQRTQHLTERAQQHRARADQRDAAFHAIADHIPLGQPILTGHHSAPAARRDRARMDAHLRASVEHDQAATEYQRQAREAQAAPGARHAPVTVANRIARLTAELRDLQRRNEHFATRGRPGALDERIERTRIDLQHWEGVRQEQIASGQIREFGPGIVRAGDQVLISGQWRRVVRANAKSVRVATGYSWTDRVAWARVSDHRPGPASARTDRAELLEDLVAEDLVAEEPVDDQERVVGQEPA